MSKAKKKIKQLTGKFSDFSGIVLKAAARGDLDAVDHYLSINPKWLNQAGPHGRTLLWEAVYKNRVEMVKALLKRGAKVNIVASYYTPMFVELSPLAVASQKNFDEMISLLKKHGAKDDFYAACHRGDLSAMKRFIKRNPKIVNIPASDEPKRIRMGWHALHYAVVGGSIDAVKLLVDNGALVAPHIALLLDWGEGKREICQFLMLQADKEEVDLPKSKREPRRLSKKIPSVPEIDQPDWLGYPELVDACRGNHNAQDHPDRVQSLLDRGANVNIQDYKKKTPMHRAGQAGFIKIPQLLFDHGASLEIEDEKGNTPIFDAAAYGRIKTLKLLLKLGANRRHKNNRGETALFAAARAKQLAAVQVLGKSKADLRICNKKGKTVLEVVRSSKQTPERVEIVDWIESKLA